MPIRAVVALALAMTSAVGIYSVMGFANAYAVVGKPIVVPRAWACRDGRGQLRNITVSNDGSGKADQAAWRTMSRRCKPGSSSAATGSASISFEGT